MKVRVLIRPKAGILDPQGKAVQHALESLGFSDTADVHVGRLVELDVVDPQRVPEMCELLLANTLIEEYEILDERNRPLASDRQVAPDQSVSAQSA